ncbi:MAG: carbon-nitrogen hydrolase family protein [Clostridia bacterium]|nr:carbon-nitrogen hydrolase family protein [Clostridia bacterium]
MKIALLQLLPGNPLEKGIDACKKAKEMGADVALFPEMWSSGYAIDPALALPADGAFVKAFQALAEKLEMAIGVTLLEQFEPAPRNTMILFDRHGKKILHYAKVHTCDFGDEEALTPGEDFYVAELDTAEGVVKVGAMICYDREFPESARLLMLKGAEVILVPNACPMEINRLAQLRGRAYENMVAIATCNYPAPHPDCNGHSSVFDGIVYLPDVEGSRDTKILESEEEEGIYVAELSLETLRWYRENEVHGNAYRRPEKYHLLTEERIDPPFVRSDRRK